MSRPAFLTGLVLVALGLAVLAWKTLLLGLPVVPSGPEDLWRVELAIDARGSGARGSVRVALPQSEPGQTIFDEHLVSGRLLFTIRTPDDQRTGIWSGSVDGVHRLAHAFRVQLAPLPERALDPAAQPPQAIRDEFGRAGRELPSESAPIREALATVIGPALEDSAARVRTLFAFVADEIATAPSGSHDALLVLAAREGSEQGKARLLVTLLRAAGVPARVAAGLHLAAGKDARPATWAEAWVGGDWLPLSPTEGFLGTRPADLLVLRRGEGPLVEAIGVEAVGYRWHVLREQLRREELAVLTVPPNAVLARLSLYRLPLGTQDVLRVLLLIPLGALVVSLFRNVVGINTFGTFMPILLALAMRGTGLVRGLAMIGSVILVGIGGRLLLDRLQLLMVPRLCVLLCLVVLTICGMSLLGYGFESLELYAGVLFPIVILTMLIERFSVTIAEEGLREALIRLGNSTLVALCAYPLFQSAFTEHLMFGFPEVVIAVTGVLVMIGGYTGYRLTELRRFRSLAVLVRGPTA
jgi:transglutaminase-like putative cysteine protease